METTAYSVENNVKYLASGMFYLGFGNRHEDTLTQKLNSALSHFQIQQPSASQRWGADFELEFKRAEGQEWMNLSGYRATLKEDPNKTQYFSVYKNHGFTNKEALNLLEGRSVCKQHVNKTGMKYETWNKLDFENRTENGNFVTKKFPENHGFSIEAAFKKIDFAKEMPDWSITSLKKGDEVYAPILVNGQETEMMLTANPEKSCIEGRDQSGNLVLQVEGVNELLVKDRQQSEQTSQTDQAGQSQAQAGLSLVGETIKEQQQDQAQVQQPSGNIIADQQVSSEEQQPAKENPVAESIQNDPAQKKTAADPLVKSEKAKVEKIPRRSHPPLQQSAQGQGKKR